MRLFELLTLILILPTCFGVFLAQSKRPRLLVYLPSLALIALLIHLVVEGHRWQMFPAYFLAALHFLRTIAGLRGRSEPKTKQGFLKIAGAVVGLLILIAAIALPALFPVFTLPAPSGKFAVGIVDLHLVDESRPETFTADPDDRRELMIRVWYPAEKPADRDVEPYVESREIGRRLSRGLLLPPFLFTYLALARTNSYRDAVPAASDKGFPVLLYSHAFAPGFVSQNSAQMEALASHGYVVIGISHPHEAGLVVFPENRTVLADRDHALASMREMSAAIGDFQAARNSDDPIEKEQLLRTFFDQSPIKRESLDRWVEDTLFVSGELGELQSGAHPNPLVGRLDLERLGVFGMDLGGAVAAQVCLIDPGFKAGLNYSGIQYGDLLDGEASRPFMAMYAEINAGNNDFIYSRAFPEFYSFSIDGSRPFNYSDFSLVSRVFRNIGLLGPIDGDRMTRIVNAYTLAFFDQHLKGEKPSLLNTENKSWPEVQLSIHKK